MSKSIKQYKDLLPARIHVTVEKNEDGSFWAKIKEIPYCYTQAANANELTEMLNDAIFTHFEIPEKIKKNIGFYVPISEGHMKVEEMFRNLIRIEKRVSSGVEVKEIFSLTANELC